MRIHEKDWYKVAKTTVIRELGSDLAKGLSEKKVAERREKYGENVLQEGHRVSAFLLLVRQFTSPLIIVLLLAGIATLLLREHADAIVVFVVVILNALIGFYQENRANKAFAKLAESQRRRAVVIREGVKRSLDATQLVPGDLILLGAGDYVPADARIIDVSGLSVNEAALTGEWVGVSKKSAPLVKKVPLTGQTNMIFMGTLVAAGSAVAVVTATGAVTELGRIAESLKDPLEIKTNFQKSVEKITRFLTGVIFAAVVIIFLVGLLRGEPLSELVLLVIAVAVAAIPAGLPIVVTVVLAIGLESILARGGLVKHLSAAETLGSTTVILTDKTGTLTKADMQVGGIYPTGGGNGHERQELLKAAVLTSDAVVESAEKAPEELVVSGRPIERALMLAGIEAGIDHDKLIFEREGLDFLPFHPDRRYAASLNKVHGRGHVVFAVGAPETIMRAASCYKHAGKTVRLTGPVREKLAKIYQHGTEEGMMFIAVLEREVEEEDFAAFKKEDPVRGGTVLGFLGLHDPMRETVPAAMKTAQEAGARVIMVTGDHAGTARKIALAAGIVHGNKVAVLTGEDVAALADDELSVKLKVVSVFARMLPEQKLRLCQLLQKDGEIVAMTGDGVNDAPSLVHADIGVAPDSGTSVAKEASDLILLDGSFSVIVYAIEEGRRILDNLKKSVAYLLSTGFGEIILVGGSLVFGLVLPILPTQILWAKVVEEGFMSLAFAFEPKEGDVMRRDPRSDAMRTILTDDLKQLIGFLAVVTGLFLLALFWWLLDNGYEIDHLRTIMFAALSIDSIFITFSIKNLHVPFWRVRYFSNRYLLVAYACSILALLAALFVPPLQLLLSLVPLGGKDLLLIVGVGALNLLVIEIGKGLFLRN